MRAPFTISAIFTSILLLAQERPQLTVGKIMQDPKSWVGTSPERIFWSEDSKTVYFNWNPDLNPSDSLYKVNAPWSTPVAVSQTEQKSLPSQNGVYDRGRTKKLYIRDGDLFMLDIKKGSETRITYTSARESDPVFSMDENSVIFSQGNDLFRWDIDSGVYSQLTSFQGEDRRKSERTTEQDDWLEKDQLAMFQVLQQNESDRAKRKVFNQKFEAKGPPEIEIGKDRVTNVQLSPKEDFITYSLFASARNKRTVVPDYVTRSGYTEDLNARSKVGSKLSDMVVWIYNRSTGEKYAVKTDGLSGIDEAPHYYQDYGIEFKEPREVYMHSPIWSGDGNYAVITFRSKDNKDRWICLLDPVTGEVKELDRQHNDAWIAGPGIGWSFSSGTIGWMPDNTHIYFQSEESGFSHLYTLHVDTGKKTALTSGNYEVYEPRMSSDKQWWYFVANQDHPGIRQLYKIPLNGGTMSKVTDLGGRVDAEISPDGKMAAILHSRADKPTELYIMANLKKPSDLRQVTDSPSEDWKAYPWRVPEFITFEARDGAEVHARLYRPENTEQKGPAVIFVHGAGYLQNAHQWWSSYFREYMFHNLLADKGYTVLDIDYRGSAGYGSEWRTGIYQHMGGFDLTDQVDGARYLVESFDIDPERIGIYGGSYGGFITLMAMFTEAETFAAGAALRSVTDWAHYNHGYTSNILNTPVTDSLAYRKSSPIYYAEGLEGALLICHGIIDTNVHFQDVVRLAQRLIELGKENWEFAVYPKEGHGFVHPSSWTDEYSRILKLFEENLK